MYGRFNWEHFWIFIHFFILLQKHAWHITAMYLIYLQLLNLTKKPSYNTQQMQYIYSIICIKHWCIVSSIDTQSTYIWYRQGTADFHGGWSPQVSWLDDLCPEGDQHAPPVGHTLPQPVVQVLVLVKQTVLTCGPIKIHPAWTIGG